jgi:H+/Cl- antiporter ClcA
MHYRALIPCLFASFTADHICQSLPITHVHYAIQWTQGTNPALDPSPIWLLFAILCSAVAFGLAGFAFSELTHAIKSTCKRYFRFFWMAPLTGGLAVLLISAALGTQDYLGLGVETATPDGVSIVSAFQPDGANPFSWFWKLLLTAITLACGFKGGEVTPLFFIGATLGNSMAALFNCPPDLLAGLGFIAVFAAATNTPIACTLMGVELFGGSHVGYYAMACFIAYAFSGHSGIYHSQRIAVGKFPYAMQGEPTLAELRERPRD